MRIAIFPGSFNPVHQGHVQLALHILDTYIADEVWMLVTPRNPLKAKSDLIDEADRLAMVRLAVADVPGLAASDFEFRLPRPSYTIDTLRQLEQSYPEHQFVLMIGSDNALIFDEWKEHDELLKRFEVYVYPRPGFPLGDAIKLYPAMKPVDTPLYPIASTQLREMLKKGIDTGGWLHAEVARYIDRHRLYRC